MTDTAARRSGIEVEGSGRTFRVKIASGSDEYEQAFLLLAEKYKAKGYESSATKLFRFTPFHVLPETLTVVALEGDRVAATLSMVPDTSLLGLPMESIYPEEVGRLRREGRKMVEVTSLADEGLGLREFLTVFDAMIRFVSQSLVRIGGETWLITVNPRHATYYQKAMGAVPLGGLRSYPTVRNAPAEAYYSDLSMMRATVPRTYERLILDQLPESVLTPSARPGDHVSFFADHSTAAERGTILEIAAFVDHFGSPPRWQESGLPLLIDDFSARQRSAA